MCENLTLREKSPYSDFFWSAFPHIRTEYGPENSEHGHLLRSVMQKKPIHILQIRILQF